MLSRLPIGFILLIALISCKTQKSDKEHTNTLFTLLDEKETGIDFINELKDNAETNIFSYRSYYNGGGVAIGDINNDGLNDIFLTSNQGDNKLYINKGNWQFEDVTEKAGIKGTKYWSTGVTMADVNADGWLDIYVCNSGNIEGKGTENELFINQQDGTFKESAAAYNLADKGLSTHAVFFDYDLDGDLDCYILNNSFRPIESFDLAKDIRHTKSKMGGDRLFRNDHLHFTDVTEEAGIYSSDIGFGLGVSVSDINGDGYPDIYISNDFFEKDYLYINQQNGTFKESIEALTGHLSLSSMGGDIADINNDGYFDIFTTEMLPEDDKRYKLITSFESYDNFRKKQQEGYYNQYMQNCLQLNNANKNFSEIAFYAGVPATDWSWGALLFDMDNDGWKDIFVESRTDNTPPLQPSNIDLNAGTWRPVLLSGPTEFAVPAPAATNTPDYIAQVNEIKTWQAKLTNDEKRMVKYWSAGAVLRWNEILRELVAKHNLPPYQNPDNTYPFSNANNPLAYPQFPFANPPYAARAYAYIAAAQYDALVAAWYYKKLYNRSAPYAVDPTVTSLIPKSDLPSYPSEDAVVAGAAVELLKLLFPGDQDFIQQKAEEHKRSRIIAGANVRSDIEAGEALGRAVAQKFVTRARGDRAGAAIGTQAQWTQMEADAIAKGETPWYSLEVPRRPPMLPLFGKVKTFLFDSLTAISLRPPPPPLVKSQKMVDETKEIYEFVNNPTRERTRIVHFWADGVATYTPSGHWDAIAAEDFIPKNFSEVRWARNMALINMSLMDAAIVCWDTKYFYFNPRPTQLDPKIKTITGIPNFPSYISGHSTFSGAAAAILGHIIPEKQTVYDAMALEASLSRMYGGIHYRSDCTVGLQVGKNIGNYAVQRAMTDGAE